MSYRWSYPVVLASGSPRRRDLLGGMGFEFEVLAAEVDEEGLTDADPWVTAKRLAREKALWVYERRPGCLVVGGDTVVALREGAGAWRQLAKPVDEADAFRMLCELRGRAHTVVTGVCVKWPKGFASFADESEVTFGEMSDEEVWTYVRTGEPMDKAGAYGLQGGARPFVREVRGSVDNVIGLPTERLAEVLREVE